MNLLLFAIIIIFNSMKNLIGSIIVLQIFSSCIKDRHCDCTYTDQNGPTRGERYIIKGTRKSVKRACASHNYVRQDSEQKCHSD